MTDNPTFTLRLDINSELPRLAWCAQITKDQPEAIVKCGPWVESIQNGFTAGAWDGKFEEGRPDLAKNIFGSAGLTTNKGFMFLPPSHTLEWLQMVRVNDTLYISNSLPMLLADTNDEPDVAYPDYYFDLLEMNRAGISATPCSLRTNKARQVKPILYRNLLVKPDLSLQFIDKDPGPVPSSFENYLKYLQQSVTSISNNATSSDRAHPFELCCTVSSGYDSTAAAVLGSNAGCKQALCFTKSGTKKTWGEDSGKTISEQLGMNAQEYSRDDLLKLEERPDHEFYISPLWGGTTIRSFLLFSDKLKGALLITGMHGRDAWSINHTHDLSEFKRQFWSDYFEGDFIEYSLRKGFIHFPVPYIGGRHTKRLQKIGSSRSMAPWSIGGDYDRPIPRRIAEDAGIKRSLFGIYKRGGNKIKMPNIMCKKSQDDYINFLSVMGSRIPDPIPEHILKRRHTLHFIQLKIRFWPVVGRAMKILIGNRLHSLWRNQWSYGFHWGLTRMCQRYRAQLSSNNSAIQNK